MRISVRGASENNLQDIDVDFEDGLTVVTGVSGSGKTSLVFDTLFHEARRRFLDSFAAGASSLRLSPARVRSISGLGPVVAVGQHALNRNPASTLASASGLQPFFRLLYARFGERTCPGCGLPVERLSEDEMVERLKALAREGSLQIFIPLARRTVGSHRTLLEMLGGAFVPEAIWIDGVPWEMQPLDPSIEHDIEINLGQIRGNTGVLKVREMIHQAAGLGAWALIGRRLEREWTFSQAPICAGCGRWFGELEPVHFHSACLNCQGKGCPDCAGTGLHPEAAATRWQGLRLPDLLEMSVTSTLALFTQEKGPSSANHLKQEIIRRLEALAKVGLGYISLDRSSPTLSRGESQRVRLAVSLTNQLEDVLHLLDEPTVGQHPADVSRLLPAFRQLPGPVIYVEHDRAAAAEADHAIDLGPGAGSQGGRLLFTGTPSLLWQADTPTGRFFSQRSGIPTFPPLAPPGEFLTVRAASLRNLQHIDVPIPVSRLTVISGVSGSGKSTLVEDVLVASLASGRPEGCREITGLSLRPNLVDQSPIGVNPRSNPATYTGLADIIRDLFAAQTGLTPSHFSFNRPEGACPTCKGMGAIEVRLRYLPSTWIPCAECSGQRFSEQVLSARATFNGQAFSIADFYRIAIGAALPLLLDHPGLSKAKRSQAGQVLHALVDVGLEYLPLGQASPTLSGGESQRVKLARCLGQRSLAGELLVLDEPSTGLHPQDIAGLLTVMHRLVASGATIVVVEHNLDILRAANWVIDLGPGAGPEGGKLVYAGPVDGLTQVKQSQTGQALLAEKRIFPEAGSKRKAERHPEVIQIRGARANNLKSIDVDIPKNALTVVTGVSGSGKSSLIGDVLEAEARRRYLESLSMYERQGVRSGPEAEVDSAHGLGVTASLGTDRRIYERRATVGSVTELIHHLAALFAFAGERDCFQCGHALQRDAAGQQWECPACGQKDLVAEPRHFLSSNYAAACLICHGVGTLQVPRPDKLIIHPEKPLCDGAMYSPGFFPKGYLGKPFNGGYDLLQAMAGKYGFDPFTTPWQQMTEAAQKAFLFGDPQPMVVTFHSRNGRTHTGVHPFPGFYGWIRDWDVGGTYTDTRPCPDCGGGGLRLEYARFRLVGHTFQQVCTAPLEALIEMFSPLQKILENASGPKAGQLAERSFETILQRLHFLNKVGLGYLQLNRTASSLSAGEAQRIHLAALLGSELTSLTVLLDEPTRGLHPSEVEALLSALQELKRAGNTVVVVEHEPLFMRAADHLVDMGPGAGAEGGQVVAQGSPEQILQAATITGQWLRGEREMIVEGIRSRKPRQVRGWMVLRGARANNLAGMDVRFPLGMLVGICGVSGSGKSTLMIDTLGRALVPKKYTTSVAREPVDPGEHSGLEGAPRRAVLIDQTRASISSPADYLGLVKPVIALYAGSEDARASGLNSKDLEQRCSACNGRGTLRIDMGFLADVYETCEVCQGTGFQAEAWQVHLSGIALPDLFGMTLIEVSQKLGKETALAGPLAAAVAVGLGYLVLRQPGYSLSGGEAQRLKIAAELCRKIPEESLYILDEPTIGQHLEDVARLIGVLHRLVDGGHTVLVVEHHPRLLAACDWLIELGPGGGPHGGQIIASGTPDRLARGNTPTAPYLQEILGGRK